MAESSSAHDQITAVIHRYATGIDTKNWDVFATCFTDDAAFDYGDIGQWNSAQEITAFMTAAHVPMRDTQHMMHNIVIAMDGADRATAVTYVHTVQALDGDAGGWVDAVGQYDDEFVRTGDGWRIARRKFTLTRMLTSFDLKGH